MAVTERTVHIAEPIPEPLVEDADTGEIAPEDIRRNMRVNILNDSLENTAFADIGIAVTPLLVFLGATNTTIGLVSGQAFMGLIGLVASPFITRRFRIKKWYYAGVCVPWLTALGLLGLMVLFKESLHLTNARLLKYVVISMLGAYSLFGFMNLPSREFMAACIPARLRGRLAGYSLCVGGALSIIAAFIARWILKNIHKPDAFGYVILMACAIYIISVVPILFAREKPTPVEKSPRAWSKDMFKAALDDKPFLRVIILMNLYAVLIAPVGTFVMVYGFKELKMIPATAATMAIIGYAVRISVSPIGGHLVDRFTPQRLVPYLFPLMAAVFLPPIIFRSPIAVYVSGAISTLYGVILVPANTSLTYSLPTPENRAAYFTFSAMLSILCGTLGPVMAGFFLDIFRYREIFIVVAMISLAFYPFSKLMLRGVVQRA